MYPKDTDRMANSVDPDQTAPDLGLHCFPRPVCPKIEDQYSTHHVGRLALLVFIFCFLQLWDLCQAKICVTGFPSIPPSLNLSGHKVGQKIFHVTLKP